MLRALRGPVGQQVLGWLLQAAYNVAKTSTFMPILCDCLLSLQLLQTSPLVASEPVLATGKVTTVKKLIREMSTETR